VTNVTTAHALLVGGGAVLLDTVASSTAQSSRAGRRHVSFRSGETTIKLRRDGQGFYRIRGVVRDVILDGQSPIISASLEVGGTSFSGWLSCSAREPGHYVCRE
jgi:hypothetical protein